MADLQYLSKLLTIDFVSHTRWTRQTSGCGKFWGSEGSVRRGIVQDDDSAWLETTRTGLPIAFGGLVIVAAIYISQVPKL